MPKLVIHHTDREIVRDRRVLAPASHDQYRAQVRALKKQYPNAQIISKKCGLIIWRKRSVYTLQQIRENYGDIITAVMTHIAQVAHLQFDNVWEDELPVHRCAAKNRKWSFFFNDSTLSIENYSGSGRTRFEQEYACSGFFQELDDVLRRSPPANCQVVFQLGDGPADSYMSLVGYRV